MQLPPADELVLVSGLAPIRAKKLRYYEDRNFTSRVMPPPELSDGCWRDHPAPRSDDWSGQVRGLHEKLAIEAEDDGLGEDGERSEEHTSELQSLMRISYAVFCLKKKKQIKKDYHYIVREN